MLTKHTPLVTIRNMKQSTTSVSRAHTAVAAPKKTKGLATKSVIVAAAVIIALSTPVSTYLGVTTGTASAVSQEEYQRQIDALNKEIGQYQSQAKELNEKAKSLQNELEVLSKQKAMIQAQIDISQKKHDQLQEKIAQTKRDIKANQDALGDTLADMYVDRTISPLEMLASSRSLGDYVVEQDRRDSIQTTLSETITRVNKLKKQLEEQKKEVERVLADQKNAREALAAKEREQADLLARTQNEEANYQKLTADRESEKARVQKAQQDAIQAAIRNAGGGGSLGITSGDGSMGGYPWAGGCTVDANALSHGGASGGGEDPLGYGCRQCVSYTAWKTYQKTGYAPRYWGNANMWPAAARNAGFSTGRTPRANALGVISAGQYGHIVYIEGYDAGSNTVRISQFNYFNAGGPGWGHYSEMTVPASTYDTYIYL